MTFDPSNLLRFSPPGPERMWLVRVRYEEAQRVLRALTEGALFEAMVDRAVEGVAKSLPFELATDPVATRARRGWVEAALRSALLGGGDRGR